jgi:hypothetical protein
VVAGEPDRVPLTVGQRWHAYQIGDRIESTGVWCFQAVNVGMLDDVIVRAFPTGSEAGARTKAWKQIRDLCHPGIVEEFEEYEENGYRYEVSRVPPATTLREWAACRQASGADVETLIRQLAKIIAALHDRGVVHLNLRPDTIFIGTVEEGLQVIVGGLELATTFDQPALIPVAVNPYYAPPEAAGLVKHSPGPGLRAWDWWSIGRVLQELVLGKHVLGHILNRDISKALPEHRSRAEALLLEREANAPRAGAVETMPTMDDRTRLLLRGLLASSRDGRWGREQVEAWLQHETVKDRYTVSRNERLFHWKGRAFAVPEAAEFFARAENWADGLTNLFEPVNPQTLAHFIEETPGHKKTQERLEELYRFMKIPAWADIIPDVLRTVIASAAWVLLAGEGARFLLRGRRVDTAFVRELLRKTDSSDGVATVQAMSVPAFVQLIEKTDAEAGRLLSQIGTTFDDVCTRAAKHAWFTRADVDQARLLLLALEPEAALREQRRTLQQQFACTRDENLQAIFVAKQPTRSDLVLLAYVAQQAERFRFVTHAEWSRERHLALAQRGQRLISAIFWLRLKNAIKAGPLFFGSWPLVLAAGSVVCTSLALSGIPRANLVAGSLAILLVASRIALWWQQRRSAARYAADVKPWGLNSGVQRCEDEIKALTEAHQLPRASEYFATLDELNQEITALALETTPARLNPPPLPWLTWSLTVASWLMPLGLLGWAGGQKLYSRSITTQREEAARQASEDRKADDVGWSERMTKEDLFFLNPRVPLKPWNFAPPPSVPPLELKGNRSATPAEVAAALVEGQRRLLPYSRRTVNTVIAVDVPSAAEGRGLLLYDGKRRAVADWRVFVPKDLPADQTWFKLEDKKVLFLAEPAWSADTQGVIATDEAALEESAIRHHDKE